MRVADRAYVALCAVVLALMVSQAINGIWGGDFWEHAAVLRELTTHPWRPRHPLFDSAAPNAFFSPYTVALALIARLVRIGPIGILSIAGIANLGFLFVTLRQFVRRLITEPWAPFFVLLFVLLLWGPEPWDYSGSLHLGVLGFVLPYPSTFATALVFLSWSLTIDYLRERRFTALIGLFASTVVIILTHPFSAIVLAGGVGALGLGVDRTRRPRLVANLADLGILALVIAVGFAASIPWPYYPVLRLLSTEGVAFHESNQPMYSGLLLKTFPAALGLIPLAGRFRTNWLDPLGLLFLGLLAIYLYGGVTEQWSYGRVAAFMVMMPQIALAEWVASRVGDSRRWRPAIRVAVAAGFLGLIIAAGFNFQDALVRSLPSTPSNYRQYLFLVRYTRQYDVVLADLKTSWFVPPFGGKVVANRSMAFIADREARSADVERFFDPASDRAERAAILAKYRVDYVLLPKDDRPDRRLMLGHSSDWGRVVYDDDRFRLVKTAR